MNQNFTINNKIIEPGQQELIRASVGRLPSDTKIFLNVHVFRSVNPGPTVLVMGGVHGDEINGVEIVRRTLRTRMFENLECGSVLAIPVLNVFGFNNFSREVPDGKDVNRSFPGSLGGSLASRVARILTKKILPLVDFGIDFHTGGRSHFNYPQIRYTKGDAKSKELARAFAPPYLIAKSPIPKSLRKVAIDAKKPILVYEGGENLRLDGFSIQKGLEGLQRVLFAEGMIKAQPPKGQHSIHFEKTSWLRASKAGMFQWTKKSGHPIFKGEPLGAINDPFGQDEIPVVAKQDGYIIGHNNAPVVSMGDALFHIGYT